MVDFMEGMRGPLWMNVSGVRKRSPKGLRLELQLQWAGVGPGRVVLGHKEPRTWWGLDSPEVFLEVRLLQKW